MATWSNSTFTPNSAEDIFDKIVLPHGDAAGNQKNVVLQSQTNLFAQIGKIVPSDAQQDRLRAGFGHLCMQCVAVAVANLAGVRSLAHLDQFVSRREDGDARPL